MDLQSILPNANDNAQNIRFVVTSTIIWGALSFVSGNPASLRKIIPILFLAYTIHHKRPWERLRRLKAAVAVADGDRKAAKLYCKEHWHTEVVDVTERLLQINMAISDIEGGLLADQRRHEWSLGGLFQMSALKAAWETVKSIKAMNEVWNVLREYLRQQWEVIDKIETQRKNVREVQLTIRVSLSQRLWKRSFILEQRWQEMEVKEDRRRFAQEMNNLPYSR
ncbi:hypothetical protein R3P38DRAFT_3187223 [Favolaschia claudopus]|uniref:ATP synthase protein MI25 n=1 Tax=Favolaschia claudopus TaxID=2862362 RepID=A0AAW0BZ44_9AGAR